MWLFDDSNPNMKVKERPASFYRVWWERLVRSLQNLLHHFDNWNFPISPRVQDVSVDKESKHLRRRGKWWDFDMKLHKNALNNTQGHQVTTQKRLFSLSQSSDGSRRNKARWVQTVGRLTLTWSNVFCSPLPCLRRWKRWLNGLCTGWGIKLLSGLNFCQDTQGF